MTGPAAAPAAGRLARCGVATIYAWRHGRLPDLYQPRRFTEWVQWRKLNDRCPALAALTGKAHGKAVAEARIGRELIIPTAWIGTRLPERPEWPFPFIVKANHGCNQWIVVRGEEDYARARRIAPAWLKRAYGGLLGEWHYRAARRAILVEPFIGGSALPIDYKVYVFGGRAEAVQVHVGRGDRHRWAQVDRDWRPLSDPAVDVRPPPRLDAMLEAAERAAGGQDFLRVDFYCVEDRLLFGEYCLFPGSGLDRFRPESIDRRLGDLWSAARGSAICPAAPAIVRAPLTGQWGPI